jgi:hypothetical protein
MSGFGLRSEAFAHEDVSSEGATARSYEKIHACDSSRAWIVLVRVVLNQEGAINRPR